MPHQPRHLKWTGFWWCMNLVISPIVDILLNWNMSLKTVTIKPLQLFWMQTMSFTFDSYWKQNSSALQCSTWTVTIIWIYSRRLSTCQRLLSLNLDDSTSQKERWLHSVFASTSKTLIKGTLAHLLRETMEIRQQAPGELQRILKNLCQSPP